ncbi:zinc finger, CCHC-type containing protein [Tanacetum coccineum]
MQMTYDRIHKALQELGLENVYEPQDYLILICLGTRKSPHGVEPISNEKASNAANSPLAKENLLENVVGEDLTNLEAENKTRTIINLKGKNERLLKKIQETNIKSHVTDVTNLDTMPMNVQTNARIKSENNPILLKKT